MKKLRKLDKKNKIFIVALSIFAFLVLILVIIFIVFKFKDLKTKYEVKQSSYVYNSYKELIDVDNDTFIKKTMVGKYYLVNDNEKVNLLDNPVVYNKDNGEVLLLGTFHEVMNNGEVQKLKGETRITGGAINRFFKISDRRYLIIASSIKSSNDSFKTSNYLLVDIDRVGNANLYNHEINIKTFSELEIVTDDFVFNVNLEYLTRNDEVIDLSKINGSSNKYPSLHDKEEGSGGNDDTGNNDFHYNVSIITDPLFPTDIVHVNVESKVTEVYVEHKTNILGVNADVDKINISYFIYDPMDEYKDVILELTNLNDDTSFVTSLNKDATEVTLTDVTPDTKYRLNFYYSYIDEDGQEQVVQFDSYNVTTKSINVHISLDLINKTIVQYKLKIDDYLLDSATVVSSVDGVVISKVELSKVSLEAALKGDYIGEIEIIPGEFVVLSLENAIYKGNPINVNASYKFKL